HTPTRPAPQTAAPPAEVAHAPAGHRPPRKTSVRSVAPIAAIFTANAPRAGPPPLPPPRQLVVLQGRFDRWFSGIPSCLCVTYQTYLEAPLDRNEADHWR